MQFWKTQQVRQRNYASGFRRERPQTAKAAKDSQGPEGIRPASRFANAFAPFAFPLRTSRLRAFFAGSARCPASPFPLSGHFRGLTYPLVYTIIYSMSRTAKLFPNGRSQAVRLPSEFRFEGSEVYVRRDPATGDVILSRRPESWQDFFDFIDTIEVPGDFLEERQDAPPQKRKLF